MPDKVARWLEKLELGKYVDVFVDNDIDEELLPELTDTDLEKLGISSLGHRKKLLKAIAELRGSAPIDTPASPKPGLIPPVPIASEAERRQLTVMFCDLVGSTVLAERLDPEELRDLLAQYQETCADVIQRYDGHIARYVGDGLLVYFSYPQAHEDDPERAVRAGLGIVEAVQILDAKLEHLKASLAVRIGITTGLVVAGDIGSGECVEENAIVGETPNIAARLQELAEPNTVIIGASTQRLIEGLFECNDLGSKKLKGVSRRVEAYRVEAASQTPSRFEAKATHGLLPLVGREEEISLLRKRWTQAIEGESQVVLLSGEAGIGKSRIVKAFQEPFEGEIRNRVLYYCSTYHQNSALYPVIDQLERALRFEKSDGPAQKLDKLETALSSLKLGTEDLVPLLASLLELPVGERYPPIALRPDQLKKKTLEALVTLVEAMTMQNPVLMVVEDVHWSDPSTLELISAVIEQLRSAPFLLVIVFRPEFIPPWGGRTHVTALTLNRLTRKDSGAMITNITGDKALPAEIVDQIVTKTDGVPLFIEELTKTVLESGLIKDTGDRYVLAAPLPPLAIPASLQDSLMARLDRLAPAKEVAQVAATLGRTFSHELLSAVSPVQGKALEKALRQLVKTELVYCRGIPPDARYEFKHALVQEAAYQSLLKSTRQQYHKKIAHVLEKQFPQTAVNEPELLAHHYVEAHLPEQALSYLQQAGAKAATRSAYREAATCLERALSALNHLPETPGTLERIIDLRIDLRNPLWALTEFDKLYEHLHEAEAQAKKLDDPRRLGWVSMYLSANLWITGQAAEAHKLGARASDIAETIRDFDLRIAANFYLGLAAFATGELRHAEDVLRRIIDTLDGDMVREHFGLVGPPSALARAWLSCPLAERGEFEEAISHGKEGLRIAESLDHPFTVAFCCWGLAYACTVKGELTHAITLLERGEVLSRDFEIQTGTFIAGLLGYVYALSGKTAEGLPLLHHAVKRMESLGMGFYYSLPVIHLSEASLLADQVDDALTSAKQALAIFRERGERAHEAQTLRLLGEIFARCDPPDFEKAEKHYHDAMTLAKELSMRPLVAHCHFGLSTLYQRIAKQQQAQEHIAIASELYRKMDMEFFLDQAEAALKKSD